MVLSFRSRLVATTGLLLAAVLVIVPPASGMVADLSFSEVVAHADLVFYGTVVAQECRYGDGSSMIFTDTTFAIEELIVHRPRSKALVGDTVVLSSAGGRIGDYMVGVSDVPKFVTGRQYVVFARYDDLQYASPVVGGFQGVFPVTVDEVTGVAYPLTADRRTVTRIDPGGMSFGPRTERIANGAPVKAAPLMPDLRFRQAPVPVGISAEQGARAASSPGFDSENAPREAITLDDFIDRVRRHPAESDAEVR